MNLHSYFGSNWPDKLNTISVVRDKKGKMAVRGAKAVFVGNIKGGVGKSTVSTNLACAIAQKGYKVGLADADLHGPNIPKLIGAENIRLKAEATGIVPFETENGVKVASLGFLIEDPNMHIAWRDAVKFDFIVELLGNINWGELDYLLIDLPPGTGNEQITIIDPIVI